MSVARGTMRLIAALITGLVVALIAPTTSADGVPPSLVEVHAYSYDDIAVPTLWNTSLTERGPPRTLALDATYETAGQLLVSPSACLNAPTPAPAYDYDDLSRLVQLARCSHGAEEQVGRNQEVLVVAQRSGVAANGGSRLAEASAAAFRAADNPSSIFIKNKHLASSGIRGGKFASDDIAEVQGWVAQGLRSDGVQFLPNQLDDTFRAIVPTGRVVGTAGQTNIRVIVTNDGRVINAFPVNVR